MNINKEKDDFIGSVFGEEGQLTVIAWDGRRNVTHKLYKTYCAVCAKDSELFGDGCFYSIKSKLVAGCIPCGCAKNTRWSEEQYKIRIKRKCKEYSDLEFLGFSENYKKGLTKLALRCNKHKKPYIYKNTSIDKLFSGSRGCHLCKNEKTKFINSKSAQDMIDSFFASGSFQEGTKFWKSERKTTQGRDSYWNYTCPVCSNDEYVKAGVCSGVFESCSSSLQDGWLSCRCSDKYHWTSQQREYQINKRIKEENLPYEFLNWVNSYKNNRSRFKYLCERHSEQEIALSNFLCGLQGCPQCVGQNQQECYINGVYDKETLIAIKFGIARDSNKRIKKQNKRSIFDVKQLKVFSFPSVELCKAAEAACKGELVCGILSKQEMPDGWTETTSPLNLDKIIEIYCRFGGNTTGR